ncbi:MAG: hypothetical protein IKT37_05645 [Clostridia bacterium]|nr:hypothetical protein [Clostridia bacterium]
MKIKRYISVFLAFFLVFAVVPCIKAEAATVTWVANKVNKDSYTEKDAILFTAEFGKDTLPAAAYRDYSWWRVIVCDYDFEEGVYKVISVNSTTGSGMSKCALIPKNGFVIADCYSSSFDGLVNVHVGDAAYLYMNGSTAKVTFGGKGSGTPHAPEGNGVEKISSNLADMGITAATEKGFTLKIYNYDKSIGYYLLINDASVCDDGAVLQSVKKLSSDTYEIPASIFKKSGMLTVSLWAKKGNEFSPVTRTRMVVFDSSALQTDLTEKTVVAFGDSLTAFTGWVKGMLTVIGTDVINSGVGGDTSLMGKNRFKKDVLDKNPDICIINFGMNDQAEVLSTGKPNYPLESYKENIKYFVEELQKIGCEVVLVTPHTPHNAENYYSPGQYGLDYTGKHLNDFRQAVRDIAAEYGCKLVDIAKLSENEDMAKFTMMYDGLHCSEYGHAKYLEWISEALLEDAKIAGDMNADGKTDKTDMEALKSALLAPTEADITPSDFNRNGKIDVSDYLYLKRHLEGDGELRWNK